jgi:hypothetical protein
MLEFFIAFMAGAAALIGFSFWLGAKCAQWWEQ